ncbi:MAG TPA: hypothetical protein VKJ01_19930, partial [Candidatus Solibacter sp.]|nr:hypothetical protein [Candidatus Solibacter sp.]
MSQIGRFQPDPEAFRLSFQSELPTYLNAEPAKKLQADGWLISARLLKFNHLRGWSGEPRGPAVEARQSENADLVFAV